MKWSTEVVCPVCSSATAMRVNRDGFWQRKVLVHFGVYPWKCGSCGSTFLYRKRGHRHHSSQRVAEPDPSGHKPGEA